MSTGAVLPRNESVKIRDAITATATEPCRRSLMCSSGTVAVRQQINDGHRHHDEDDRDDDANEGLPELTSRWTPSCERAPRRAGASDRTQDGEHNRRGHDANRVDEVVNDVEVNCFPSGYRRAIQRDDGRGDAEDESRAGGRPAELCPAGRRTWSRDAAAHAGENQRGTRRSDAKDSRRASSR